jgi:hypothetical protein
MLYLLQEAPANTVSYMIAGYVIIFGTMLIYLASLIVRKRNLEQDMQMLDEMDVQDG